MFAREKPKDPEPEEHEVTYVDFHDYGFVIVLTATGLNKGWYRSDYTLKYDPALEKPKITYKTYWEHGVSAFPLLDLFTIFFGKKHYWKKVKRTLLFRDIHQLREYNLGSKNFDSSLSK